MNFTRKISQLSPLSILIFHLLAFVLIGLVFVFPQYSAEQGNFSLLNYDAGWYHSIFEKGYSFHANKQSNIAFFPGFPFLWKLTGLGLIGVSILNTCLYIASIFLIRYHFKIDNFILLISLALPSVFFNYIPYSEALFFFSLSLFLIGIHKKFYWAVIGIVLASFTRSAAYTFIPVFIGMFILQVNKENYQILLKKYGILIGASIATVFFVKYIQYLETGQWIGAYEAFQHWGSTLQWIHRPLTTWGGKYLIWLDGAAVLVGAVSGIVVLKKLVSKNKAKPISNAHLFSLLYLLVVVLIKVTHAPYDPQDYSSLMSTNRYIFAVPAIIFFLDFTNKQYVFKKFDLIIFLGIVLLGYYLFGVNPNVHDLKNGDWNLILNKNIYFFGVIFLSLVLFFFSIKNHWLSLFIYLCLLIAQFVLFFDFLLGRWIG